MRDKQSTILHLWISFRILCSDGAYGYHICSYRSAAEEEGSIHCRTFRKRNVSKVKKGLCLLNCVTMLRDAKNNEVSRRKEQAEVRVRNSFYKLRNFLILHVYTIFLLPPLFHLYCTQNNKRVKL